MIYDVFPSWHFLYIARMPCSVPDDLEMGIRNQIPLWLFGFILMSETGIKLSVSSVFYVRTASPQYENQGCLEAQKKYSSNYPSWDYLWSKTECAKNKNTLVPTQGETRV